MLGCLRRQFLFAALGAASGCSEGCDRQAAKPSVSPADSDWKELAFPAAADREEQLALVYAPPFARDWPTLIALHGRGEAGRGLRAGAYGYYQDYDLAQALARVAKPPLSAADGRDFLLPSQLAAYNASLTANPYEGVVVACPYTPVPSGINPSARFATFLINDLLPRIDERLAAAGQPSRGIDGISMGGRYALEVGLAHPEVFKTVGAMQPAIDKEDAARLADLASKNRQAGHSQQLRLASSEDDPFLAATKELSDELDRRQIAHRLIVTRGPHDYIWNRGPGVLELLMFHERALRGLAPVGGEG